MTQQSPETVIEAFREYEQFCIELTTDMPPTGFADFNEFLMWEQGFTIKRAKSWPLVLLACICFIVAGLIGLFWKS